MLLGFHLMPFAFRLVGFDLGLGFGYCRFNDLDDQLRERFGNRFLSALLSAMCLPLCSEPLSISVTAACRCQ